MYSCAFSYTLFSFSVSMSISIMDRSLAVENNVAPSSLNSMSRHGLRCNSKVETSSVSVLLYLYLINERFNYIEHDVQSEVPLDLMI